MNYNESLAFFEQVKGKKIRWTSWPDDAWFIPESIYIFYLRGRNKEDHYLDCHVEEGFNLLNGFGSCWEFYSENNEEIQSAMCKKCTCGAESCGSINHSYWCDLSN
jgi:hypothetical protein